MLTCALISAVLLGAGLDDIVPAGAKVEQVGTGYRFVEGPAWDGKDSLYFSDLGTYSIHKVGPDGKVTVFRDKEKSGQANGIAFDSEGHMFVAENSGRRISKTNTDGSIVGVCEGYDGKPLNSPNDLCVDAVGGVYFTDPRYGLARLPKPEQEIEGVYYVAPDGKVTRIDTDGVRKPNGVALSPDGRVLYVCDHGAGPIFGYEIQADGKWGKGRKVAQGPGRPDGMCVDSDGRLYATGSGGINVFSAPTEGKESELLGTIAVPEGCSNCCFGGEKWDTLYITASSSVYKIKLNVKGATPHLNKGTPLVRGYVDDGKVSGGSCVGTRSDIILIP